MIFCANCGTSLLDDALFCPECGTKTDRTDVSVKLPDPEPALVVAETLPQKTTLTVQAQVIEIPLASEKETILSKPKEFCRNCGKEVAPGAYACINCGLPPMKAYNFCPSCGSDCHQDAVICIKCGIKLESQDSRLSSANQPSLEPTKAYCRNCGKQVLKGAVACLGCGLPPGKSKNFCPSCGSETHNEAVICIKCGTALEQFAMAHQPQVPVYQPQVFTNSQQPAPNQTNNILVIGNQKSVGTAFILAFFFGPLGLLYASPIGGIIMIIASIAVATATLGVGLIITQIICIIWAVIAAGNANQNAINKGSNMVNNQNK